MKPALLFQDPLTAAQLQRLRKSFAEGLTPPSPAKPTILARFRAAWLDSPLKIGLLIYANALAAVILIHALIN